jgi:hypothetical protein
MKHQAYRIVAVMLSVLLITSTSARAGSIQFAEVMQAIVDGQTGRPRVELRLRSVSQSGRLTAQSGTAANPSSTNAGTAQNGADNPSGATTGGPTQAVTVETTQDGTTGQVETVDLGDVTGTVCDCGDIPIPKGSFPKWPLLALGGIPFLFIHREKDCVVNCQELPPPCVTNCGPTTTVPEPATLFLFGSGMLALSAGARRRRARRKTTDETNVAGEV